MFENEFNSVSQAWSIDVIDLFGTSIFYTWYIFLNVSLTRYEINLVLNFTIN
jgi:hypothetical protein